jgi:hypothetical protein
MASSEYVGASCSLELFHSLSTSMPRSDYDFFSFLFRMGFHISTIHHHTNSAPNHNNSMKNRQEDNYPNDLKRSGIPIPILPTLGATYKIIAGTVVSFVGRFLLEKDWFGP